MSTHSSVIYCFLYVFCGNLALWIGQLNAIYEVNSLKSSPQPKIKIRYAITMILLWKSLPYSHVSLFAGGTLVLWRRKAQEMGSSCSCVVPGRYGAKVIIAVLLDIFLFLSYSVIYSYVSFLMRLIEIIKTLILLFILLHLYFFIDFYRLVSEIDINLWWLSIAIDWYRLSVYRLTIRLDKFL